jgi:hypothetical protein
MDYVFPTKSCHVVRWDNKEACKSRKRKIENNKKNQPYLLKEDLKIQIKENS